MCTMGPYALSLKLALQKGNNGVNVFYNLIKCVISLCKVYMHNDTTSGGGNNTDHQHPTASASASSGSLKVNIYWNALLRCIDYISKFYISLQYTLHIR